MTLSTDEIIFFAAHFIGLAGPAAAAALDRCGLGMITGRRLLERNAA
jgi:hypothetical protein